MDHFFLLEQCLGHSHPVWRPYNEEVNRKMIENSNFLAKLSTACNILRLVTRFYSDQKRTKHNASYTYVSEAIFLVEYPNKNCPSIARAADLKLDTSGKIEQKFIVLTNTNKKIEQSRWPSLHL